MANYNKMNKGPLQDECRNRGISFKNTDTKHTLIELLELNDQETALSTPSLLTMPTVNRPLEGAEGEPPPIEVEQEEEEVTPEATSEVSPAQRPTEPLGNQPPASPMSSVPPPTWAQGPNSGLLDDLQYHKYLQSRGNDESGFDKNAILTNLVNDGVITVKGDWDLAKLWNQVADMLDRMHAQAKAQAEAQARAQADAPAVEAAPASEVAEREPKPAPVVVAPASKPERAPQRKSKKRDPEVVWGVSPRALIFIIALVLVFAGVVVGLVVWDRAQERAVAAQLTQGVIDALQSIGNQK